MMENDSSFTAFVSEGMLALAGALSDPQTLR